MAASGAMIYYDEVTHLGVLCIKENDRWLPVIDGRTGMPLSYSIDEAERQRRGDIGRLHEAETISGIARRCHGEALRLVGTG